MLLFKGNLHRQLLVYQLLLSIQILCIFIYLLINAKICIDECKNLQNGLKYRRDIWYGCRTGWKNI